LDSDVAVLCGVETKRVNEAVKNNPEKFPEGFIFELQNAEKQHVVEIFDRFSKLKHSTSLPAAFTEQGLYMLATILKSEKATDTTIAIVQAFAQLRELSRMAADMVKTPEDTKKQMSFMQKTNELLSGVITNDLKTTATETTFEFNLMSAVKIKHTIKREVK
jgi:hypothetical protein